MPIHLCSACGSTDAGPLLCRECKTPRSPPSVAALHVALSSWVGPALSALLIPLGLLYLTNQLESSHQRTDAMASLTANLQDKLNIATDLDEKVRTLGLPCPVDLDPGDLGGKGEVVKQSECLSSFEARLAEVDHQIVRLSWSLDGAAIDGVAQVQLTALKDGYWRSCKPEDDALTCGTRERMRRIIYGGADRRALFTCPRTRLNWNVDKTIAQACWNASQELGNVVGEFEQETNLFFCQLLIDVNKRLVDLYRDKNMKALSNSLQQNQTGTRCWKLVHDAASSAPPLPKASNQRP